MDEDRLRFNKVEGKVKYLENIANSVESIINSISSRVSKFDNVNTLLKTTVNS
jgi:hypothetical protein